MEEARKKAKVQQQENDQHELMMSMTLATEALAYIKKLSAERTENKPGLVRFLNEFVDEKKKKGASEQHLSSQSSPLFFT